ncbi:MAG: hypothetical protein N4A47_04645 [Clostridia bacterium]|jgi:hypothetical protein|nr:hypothetical protein [Clostridia bacterium]
MKKHGFLDLLLWVLAIVGLAYYVDYLVDESVKEALEEVNK